MKKATKADKPIVVDILVSAFKPLTDDNSINLVVKQDAKRTKRMQILMEYLFDKAYLFGEVYLSDNEKACILMKFPHKEKITMKTIGMDIRLALKCIGIERIFSVLKRQRMVQKYYPREPHIRPMIMGVRADHDGSGAAARLMLQIRNRYQDTTLPVIIDTSSKDNVLLFQKFGFKLIDEQGTVGFPMYFLRLN